MQSYFENTVNVTESLKPNTNTRLRAANINKLRKTLANISHACRFVVVGFSRKTETELMLRLAFYKTAVNN